MQGLGLVPSNRHSVLKRTVLAALAAVLVLTAAFPVRAADPLAIDVILPLTGGAAFLGAAERRTFEIAQTVINAQGGVRGQPIEFVFHDDTSSPPVAVQLATAIAARHVPIFLGSPIVANCAAIAPIVAREGPVEYCLAPIIHPVPNGYVFAAGASSADFGAVIARYFRERGLTRVAIMTATDATGQDMDAAFDAVFARPENRAFQIVDREHFNPSDLDINAQLSRIRAANPQVLLTWTIGTPFATLLRGFRDSGFDIPLLASNGDMLYAQMTQFKGFLPKDMLFVGYRASTQGDTRRGPIRDAQVPFYRAFAAAGVRPDVAPITAWDPIFITIDALRKLGPAATAAQVRDYIGSLRGWAGVNAIYDFRGGNQRGIGASELVMDRWDAAKDDWVAVSQPGGALR
jgi:branched-chain amino acid transport system substrate-binding protein